MNIAAYVRVSSADQNLDRQLDGIKRYVDTHFKSDNVEYIQETGSTKKTRPILDNLIESARLGHYQLIIFWEMSRMGRTVSELIANMRRLDDNGIGWICIKENINSTHKDAFSEFRKLMIAAMAQLERDLMSERIREGIKAKKERGEEIGGSTKRKIVDRVAIIEDIKDGLSYRVIGKKWGVSKSFVQRLGKGVEH